MKYDKDEFKFLLEQINKDLKLPVIRKKFYPDKADKERNGQGVFFIDEKQMDRSEYVYVLLCEGKNEVTLYDDHAWSVYKYETKKALQNTNSYTCGLRYCKKIKEYTIEEIDKFRKLYHQPTGKIQFAFDEQPNATPLGGLFMSEENATAFVQAFQRASRAFERLVDIVDKTK